jgi:hypothetical protein
VRVGLAAAFERNVHDPLLVPAVRFGATVEIRPVVER